MYEFYNVFGYCQNVSSHVRGLPRFFNPLVEALNARIKLRKYVIFVLDFNFIEHLENPGDDNSMHDYLVKLLNWLVTKSEMMIRRRKTELFDKKPGALSPGSPEFIWLKMLKRPGYHDKWDKIFQHRSTFNCALECMLFNKKGYISNFILSIEVDSEEFLHGGFLSSSGKQRFWKELDLCIQKFEHREINLKPKNNSKKLQGKSTRRMLPKPPHVNTFKEQTSKKRRDYY